jgi:hypothetical protein
VGQGAGLVNFTFFQAPGLLKPIISGDNIDAVSGDGCKAGPGHGRNACTPGRFAERRRRHRGLDGHTLAASGIVKSEETVAPRKIWLLVSVGLFVACLPLNSFCVQGECGWPGYLILSTGWLLMLETPANLTWLAIPILFLSWIAILKRLRVVAIYQSLSALALSAVFLLMRTIVVSEAGTLELTGVRPAYWLWLASAIAAAIAAFLTTATGSSSAIVPEQGGSVDGASRPWLARPH